MQRNFSDSKSSVVPEQQSHDAIATFALTRRHHVGGAAKNPQLAPNFRQVRPTPNPAPASTGGFRPTVPEHLPREAGIQPALLGTGVRVRLTCELIH